MAETKRLVVPAAEAMLGVRVPVLDHGFIEPVEYMGSQQLIVQAARVCTSSEGKTEAEDERLINYLWEHKHGSPFEMVELLIHVKMPIFVARQWVRHRTASLNEISARYSKLPNECYVPELEQMCKQSTINHQGRSEPMEEDIARSLLTAMEIDQANAHDMYDTYLHKGLAKELARINLPLATYTEWFWKCDLRNFLHFAGLRMDSHAQHEIRVYANEAYRFAQALAPWACAAFEEFEYQAVTFSKKEMKWLRADQKGELFLDDPQTRAVVVNDLGLRRANAFYAKLGAH